jgi:hypothetical protein
MRKDLAALSVLGYLVCVAAYMGFGYDESPFWNAFYCLKDNAVISLLGVSILLRSKEKLERAFMRLCVLLMVIKGLLETLISYDVLERDNEYIMFAFCIFLLISIIYTYFRYGYRKQ